MSILKKILAVLLSMILILGAFTGCGEKYEDAYIYFELLNKPLTLDPQIASSDSELLIVRNMYEGLLRKDENNNIVNGVCKEYTYSNLVYTFVLKEDLVWSDGTPLTAYDFEYGFKRAVDPKIKAPNAHRLFSIMNAESIATGGADVSTLGVKAIDNTTLTITMCREDSQFTETLTTAICMPCNQEFFNNSIGKYGLDIDYIICNGSYSIGKWNKEDFGIRLYKNEEYKGDFKPNNAAVFINCIDEEPQTLRLADGVNDMAFIPCSELSNAKAAGISTKQIENICWVLSLKKDFNSDIRYAFASAFSTNVYSAALPDGFFAAKSLYPETLGVNADGVGVTPYDIDKAKSIISTQIGDMDYYRFPQSTLYYYNEKGVKELATAIVGHWQQNFSTFINIQESENLAVMQKEIGEHSLDFALFPIVAKSDYFNEYAKNFSAISSATTPETLQQELLQENLLIPVAYQTTNISYVSSLEGVTIEQDNGYIDFSYIIKR